MWGFITVINNTLLPHLRSVFDLNYTQTTLIESVWFIAYFVASMPSAFLIERVGYKKAIIIGLLIMAVGSLGMVPAARMPSFEVTLVALFVIACGIALLQVAANPYVAVIGPPETSESRLTLVQAFNSMGTFFAPYFGGYLILSRTVSGTTMEGTAISLEQRMADAQATQLPYVLVAVVLVVLALVISRAKLPELGQETRRANAEERKHLSLWNHRNLVLGVPAIFIYLIAEIGVANLFINFVSQPGIGNMTHADAANYLILLWGGMMVGRFAGAFLMRTIPANKVLAAFALAAFVVMLAAATLARPDRDVGADPCRPVPFDHVPDDLRARHQGSGPADRRGLGPADHRHRGRRAGGDPGLAGRSLWPAAELLPHRRLRALCAVVRDLGQQDQGGCVSPAVRLVWEMGAQLGEGPVWCPHEQALWFVDIKGGAIHRHLPATGACETFAVGGNAQLHRARGRWRHGRRLGTAASTGLSNGAIGEQIAAIDMPAHNRTNDATVDALGRLWLGTMDDDEVLETGALYCLDRGVLHAMPAKAIVTNGPAVTADARTLYFVNSAQRRIWRYAIADGPAHHASRNCSSSWRKRTAIPTASCWTARIASGSRCGTAGACGVMRPMARCCCTSICPAPA